MTPLKKLIATLRCPLCGNSYDDGFRNGWQAAIATLNNQAGDSFGEVVKHTDHDTQRMHDLS